MYRRNGNHSRIVTCVKRIITVLNGTDVLLWGRVVSRRLVGILPSLCCDVCSDDLQLASLYTLDCAGYEVGTKHLNFTDTQNFRENDPFIIVGV